MSINHQLLKPPLWPAGIDHLSLDVRKFDPCREDIERICLFFNIGKLKSFEKERRVVVSHSNFFVFVSTSQGPYALKFYPADAGKTITVEYALNRLLTGRHFLTPLMHASPGNRVYLASNGRLAACYSYIDGLEAWQGIKSPGTRQRINTAMLSLKDILGTVKNPELSQKQEELPSTIDTLAKNSRTLAPYDQKVLVDRSLLEACQTYKEHRTLFTRQLTHNNISLTNILIFDKNVYTLDLSHIREDYVFCDLASLVISCLHFDITVTAIKDLTKDYFVRHKFRSSCKKVLNTLLAVGLAKEYLKNIRREKKTGQADCPPGLKDTYRAQLAIRKGSIISGLKGIR